MEKFDWKTREYHEYNIPEDWYCSLYENDMERIVNCAECGKEVPYSTTYVSLAIHNVMGFGYAVCPECYKKEWEARRQAEKE